MYREKIIPSNLNLINIWKGILEIISDILIALWFGVQSQVFIIRPYSFQYNRKFSSLNFILVIRL